jgi:hypothetical protein
MPLLAGGLLMGFMFSSAVVGIPWMIRTDFSDQRAWEKV